MAYFGYLWSGGCREFKKALGGIFVEAPEPIRVPFLGNSVRISGGPPGSNSDLWSVTPTNFEPFPAPKMGDKCLSGAVAGSSVLPMRVASCSAILDKMLHSRVHEFDPVLGLRSGEKAPGALSHSKFCVG